MSHLNAVTPVFVEFIPSTLDVGALYISDKYKTAVHLCCCGCGNKVVTPLKPAFWRLTKNARTVSLYPSIGNWSLPCRSHYWIEDNVVEWSGKFSENQIEAVRARDSRDQDAYFNARRIEKSWWRKLLIRLFGK